jgi:FixJ family two-component response regulator
MHGVQVVGKKLFHILWLAPFQNNPTEGARRLLSHLDVGPNGPHLEYSLSMSSELDLVALAEKHGVVGRTIDVDQSCFGRVMVGRTLAKDHRVSLLVSYPCAMDIRVQQGPIENHPIVYLIDDDPRLRESLADALNARRQRVRVFASADEYLSSTKSGATACLILDLNMPGIDGLELQKQLAAEFGPPIIFLTGAGDIPSTVKAMKAGAIEFLTKPVSISVLLAAVDAAFKQDVKQTEERAELLRLRERLASLTPREREVLPLVVEGLLNKQAADVLGISLVTLQIHRGQVMKKMQATSLADLVRMSSRLAIRRPILPH